MSLAEKTPFSKIQEVISERESKIFFFANLQSSLPVDEKISVDRSFFPEGEKGDRYHNWIESGYPCECKPEFVEGNMEKCGKRGGMVIEFDFPVNRDVDSLIICSTECFDKLREGIDYEFKQNGWISTSYGINGFGRP